jgi:hypothetical protein
MSKNPLFEAHAHVETQGYSSELVYFHLFSKRPIILCLILFKRNSPLSKSIFSSFPTQHPTFNLG